MWLREREDEKREEGRECVMRCTRTAGTLEQRGGIDTAVGCVAVVQVRSWQRAVRSSAFLPREMRSVAEQQSSRAAEQQDDGNDGNDDKYASPRSSAKKREQEAGQKKQKCSAVQRKQNGPAEREKDCRLLLTAVNKSRTGPARVAMDTKEQKPLGLFVSHITSRHITSRHPLFTRPAHRNHHHRHHTHRPNKNILG